MAWVLVVALAVIAFAVIVFVLKVPAGAREAVAAALLLGIAGYATQGTPGEAGAPKPARARVGQEAGALVEARTTVTNKGIPPSNRWVVIADGLARNGRFDDAADVLRGAIADDPENSEAWLAMGNALFAHADGQLTPASEYAYDKAMEYDEDEPGPPFFYGLALVQEGRFADARTYWQSALDKAEGDAPWRAGLEAQLARLEAVIAARDGAMPVSEAGQGDDVAEGAARSGAVPGQ